MDHVRLTNAREARKTVFTGATTASMGRFATFNFGAIIFTRARITPVPFLTIATIGAYVG